MIFIKKTQILEKKIHFNLLHRGPAESWRDLFDYSPRQIRALPLDKLGTSRLCKGGSYNLVYRLNP